MFKYKDELISILGIEEKDIDPKIETFNYKFIDNDYLLELKRSMKFAILSTKNLLYSPVISIVTSQYKGYYETVVLSSREKVPIYLVGDKTYLPELIQEDFTNKKIDLTSDFKKILLHLNVNNYSYYERIYNAA